MAPMNGIATLLSSIYAHLDAVNVGNAGAAALPDTWVGVRPKIVPPEPQ